MYNALNGPSKHGALSVTSTAVELKVDASVADQRIVVTIQPLDGVVYFGFDNTVTSTTGTKVFKGQFFALEAADSETVYLVAESGQTVDVRITERG